MQRSGWRSWWSVRSHSVAVRAFLVAFVLAVAGCSQSPHWSDARTDLDRVPLSVWSAGDGQLFSVGGPLGSTGDTLFLRHDGAGWHEVAAGTGVTLWWVFGFSSSDVWSVGEAGTVVHWDGSVLSTEVAPTDGTLFGIWGTSDDDLWAVGGRPDIDGALLHRVAGVWQQVSGLPGSGSYFKVWGAAADDVYVCGQGGVILHWDGASWTSQPTGLDATVSLFTVAGRVGDDVYAVGGLGNAVALHLDAARGDWVAVDDPSLTEAPALAGVAVSPSGTVAMVGAGGTKLRGTPGSLHDESGQATPADFHSVAFDGAQLWAVGGNWLAPAPTARHGVIVHYGP